MRKLSVALAASIGTSAHATYRGESVVGGAIEFAMYYRERVTDVRMSPETCRLQYIHTGHIRTVYSADGAVEDHEFADRYDIDLSALDEQSVKVLTVGREASLPPASEYRISPPRVELTGTRKGALSTDSALRMTFQSGDSAQAVARDLKNVALLCGRGIRGVVAAEPNAGKPAVGGFIKAIDAKMRVTSLAWDNDGRRLFVGGPDNASLWDTDASRRLRRFHDGTGSEQVIVSPNGMLLASIDWRSKLQMCRTVDGACSYGLPDSVSWGSAFSPDGSLLAVATRKGVRVLNVGDMSIVRTIGAVPAAPLRFTSNGKDLISFSRGVVAVHRLQDGEVRVTWKLPIDYNDFVVSELGDILATAHKDGVRVWGVETGQLLATFPGFAWAVAISRDAKFIAAGNLATIRVVRFPSGQTVLTGKGPGSGTSQVALAFSPDGSVLASSGNDWMIRLWRIPR